jgi:predicted RNase H-like nuclease (RuvC/YqgF family)
MPFPRFRVCAAAAAVSLSSLPTFTVPPARAADVPQGKGASRPASLLMSRDELRACMSGQTRLRAQREEVDKLQGELAAEKQALRRAGDELKERLATLDRTSQAQTDQYAEAATAHDRRIDAYEARTTAYNARVEALQTDSAAYRKDCENRRYDAEDEQAIKRGK